MPHMGPCPPLQFEEASNWRRQRHTRYAIRVTSTLGRCCRAVTRRVLSRPMTTVPSRGSPAESFEIPYLVTRLGSGRWDLGFGGLSASPHPRSHFPGIQNLRFGASHVPRSQILDPTRAWRYRQNPVYWLGCV